MSTEMGMDLIPHLLNIAASRCGLENTEDRTLWEELQHAKRHLQKVISKVQIQLDKNPLTSLLLAGLAENSEIPGIAVSATGEIHIGKYSTPTVSEAVRERRVAVTQTPMVQIEVIEKKVTPKKPKGRKRWFAPIKVLRGWASDLGVEIPLELGCRKPSVCSFLLKAESLLPNPPDRPSELLIPPDFEMEDVSTFFPEINTPTPEINTPVATPVAEDECIDTEVEYGEHPDLVAVEEPEKDPFTEITMDKHELYVPSHTYRKQYEEPVIDSDEIHGDIGVPKIGGGFLDLGKLQKLSASLGDEGRPDDDILSSLLSDL